MIACVPMKNPHVGEEDEGDLWNSISSFVSSLASGSDNATESQFGSTGSTASTVSAGSFRRASGNEVRSPTLKPQRTSLTEDLSPVDSPISRARSSLHPASASQPCRYAASLPLSSCSLAILSHCFSNPKTVCCSSGLVESRTPSSEGLGIEQLMLGVRTLSAGPQSTGAATTDWFGMRGNSQPPPRGGKKVVFAVPLGPEDHEELAVQRPRSTSPVNNRRKGQLAEEGPYSAGLTNNQAGLLRSRSAVAKEFTAKDLFEESVEMSKRDTSRRAASVEIVKRKQKAEKSIKVSMRSVGSSSTLKA